MTKKPRTQLHGKEKRCLKETTGEQEDEIYVEEQEWYGGEGGRAGMHIFLCATHARSTKNEEKAEDKGGEDTMEEGVHDTEDKTEEDTMDGDAAEAAHSRMVSRRTLSSQRRRRHLLRLLVLAFSRFTSRDAGGSEGGVGGGVGVFDRHADDWENRQRTLLDK